MPLDHLAIRNVRNLQDVRIAPCPALNLLFGPNASGKTSVLEAIHVLGLARSFRSPQVRHVIAHGHDALQVTGRVSREGRSIPLGVQRSRSETVVRVAGETVRQLSELASHLPLQVLTPESHQLVQEGPRFRRQFVDWGVFHVEPGFADSWREYHRALRQRNHALRAGQSERLVRVWDETLASQGERIAAARRRYLAMLEPLVSEYAARLADIDVQLPYLQGWPGEDGLAAALAQSYARDREQGFTRLGPHRAELVVRADGAAAAQTLSRGQQKLLVAAMRIAQVHLLVQGRGEGCVLLVDDLPAELDAERRARLLDLLKATGAQLFVTATDPGLVPAELFPTRKKFHVKHGELSEVV